MHVGDFRRILGTCIVLSTPLSGCTPKDLTIARNLLCFLSQSQNARYRQNAEIYIFRRRGRPRSYHGRHQKPSLQDPANLDHRVVSCSLPSRATSMHELTSLVYAWRCSVKL